MIIATRYFKMAAINKRQAVLVILLILRRRRRRKAANNREIWTRSWLQRRREFGFYRRFLTEIKVDDTETFKKFTRMTPDNFQKLVTIVSPYITKQDTNMRESIRAEERLFITVRFLATGTVLYTKKENYCLVNFTNKYPELFTSQ